MSIRRLLPLLLVLASTIGCNTQGTCITIDKSEDPAGFNFCMVQYPERACRDIGEEEKKEAQFFKEDSTAGVVRCKDAGFTSKESPAEMERMLESGDSVLFQRPKSVE